MHFRSFSRKRNINTLVTVTVTVTDRQIDRHTDGRTDRILLAIPRLHYMQRGKNANKIQI